MKCTRRDFLKACAVTAALVTTGCSAGKTSMQGPTSQQDVEQWFKGVCRYCGTGCGLYAGVSKGKIIAVKGDPDCVVNKGRLCIKGILLPKIMETNDRVLHPLVKKNGQLVKANWDEALDLMASKFKEAISAHGKNSIGFYGSGQTIAEESYLANKLFKGAIGTNNIDGNPRTCMASAVAAFAQTFGKDEPMGTYADIEEADVFFLIGSNLAEAHPILYSRMVDRKNSNPNVKIIVADPRRTRTVDSADMFLPFSPGTDILLMNSMCQVIIEENLTDENFIAKHTNFQRGTDNIDYAVFKEFLSDFTPEKVTERVGISADDIRAAARLFGKKDSKTMSLWCMGVNQRTSGVFINNVIYNMHLLTGKICRPGDSPFSLTGQPSACGSVREAGALAHLLPAHRVVANQKHREEMAAHWGVDVNNMSPTMGYHTMAMFKAALDGDIKVLWVMCTNPGHSLPNLTPYRQGMEKTFLIVSEAYHPTRTSELADIVLPAALWMEKEGIYGNGERRTQHIAKAINPPGEAKPDIWVIMEIAKRLGYGELFKYKDNEAIWEDYRKCTLGTGMDLAPHARLVKEHGLTWPMPDPNGPETSIRYAAPYDPFVKPEEGIKFYGKPDGRAVIFARPYIPPFEVPDAEYPLWLSTGRILEHWHTITMTRHAPEIMKAAGEQYIEIHPDDAKDYGIRDGDMVRIISRRGKCEMKAKINGRGQPQSKMLWASFHDPEILRQINFVTSDAVDPTSRQMEFKLCAIKIEKV